MKVAEMWDAIEVVVQDGDMRLEKREEAISAMEGLRNLIEQQRLLLQELEWLPSDKMDPTSFPNLKYCPICRMPNHYGHMGNCKLKVFLGV